MSLANLNSSGLQVSNPAAYAAINDLIQQIQLLKNQIQSLSNQVNGIVLPPNLAFTNVDNNFVAQTLASGSNISGVSSILNFFDPTQALDKKRFRILNNTGLFLLQLVNDAVTIQQGALVLDRTGGNLTLTGNIAAFAGQIGFPATQNPSVGANVLDDYEEGSWTPIDSSGAGLAFTASGDYIKIGRLVWIGFNCQFPATASGAAVTIGGLPFTVLAGNFRSTAGVPFTSVGTTHTFAGIPGTTTMQVFTEAAVNVVNSTYSSRNVIVTMTYLTNN